MPNDIKKSLRELGFGTNEIKVYLAITQLGEAPASKVAKKADLPRTTVIGILNGLVDKNYLSTHRYKGATYYWIESPKAIKELLLNRIKIADELNVLLSGLYRQEADFPAAKIFDTKSGVKKFVETVLLGLEPKSVIYTIDTPHMGNYKRILSESMYNSLIEFKKKKGIVTNSLVPCGSFITIDPKKMANHQINIREMPKDIDFKASFWIIGDTLVLFSGKYPFIVSVRHRLITDSIKSIYEHLWRISEPKK